MSEQHGRKRSASCREETQSSSAWEPASKRLRSLVHQMRSLSLGDLPWSRRKVALDVRPLNPPPTPDATPLPERRRLGAGGTAPTPAAVSAAAAAAAALAAAAAVAAAAPEPRCRSHTVVNHSCSLSVPSAGFSDAYCDAYSPDPYSFDASVSEHGAKRSEDEPAGGRAKKARNRMRLGQNGVVMTSCYIEQTLYT